MHLISPTTSVWIELLNRRLHQLLVHATIVGHLLSLALVKLLCVCVLMSRLSWRLLLLNEWPQEQCQQVDHVLRISKLSNLSLVQLLLLFLLVFVVKQVLVSDCSHLLWIAEISKEWKLGLEEYVFCELLG